jgi:hypothetical protein
MVGRFKTKNLCCFLQIEQYRAEIKRLQASEAEIKALSVNYAALLKEKEVWLAVTFLLIYACNISIFLVFFLVLDHRNVQFQLLDGISHSFDT